MRDGWNTSALFRRADAASTRYSPRIGAEVELLVWEHDSNRVAQLNGLLGGWLDVAAAQFGWKEALSAKGAVKFAVPHGGTITLEPGGQLEYSSPPHGTPSELIRDVQVTVEQLRASAAAHGLDLHAVGIDPLHTLAQTPLQLTSDRYAAMDAYFASTSHSGQRMMRQTAAIQVSVDVIHDVVLTWDVLNRAAPALTALFANSRMYEGRDTEYASYRAATWLDLDTTRTGVAGSTVDPVSAYDAFARAAPSIADTPRYRPFEQISNATYEDWQTHLSTLFPDVRPKGGYFEVRCIDAIPHAYIAAPVLMVAALAWDESVLRRAAALLRPADNELRARAAKSGLNDDELRETATQLVALALEACAHRTRESGDKFCRSEDVRALEEWLKRSVAATGVASFPPGSAPLEHDLVRNDHVSNDTLTRLGK